MFINELNKKEAVAFISLVKNLSEIDKVFAEEEGRLLEDYIEELGLSEEIIRMYNLKQALKEFADSNNRIKNIVYFELLGLALVDGDFDKDEISFLNYVAKAFDITSEKEQRYLNYFIEVKAAYEGSGADVEAKVALLKEKVEQLIA